MSYRTHPRGDGQWPWRLVRLAAVIVVISSTVVTAAKSWPI